MRSFSWVKKMANTDIKWFSFDNTNAPQFTNTWGCMIDVLDACLVTGFGSQITSSLVVENGVGIVTFGSAHNFKQFQVVEISGALDPKLNTEFRIIGLSANTIEFVVDATDQTAAGTISCKVAPLGWAKVFSGENKAVYRAKDTEANPFYLRVDNSLDPVYNTNYAKFAKVGILEGCSHIDDFSANQVPYDSANPNKNWIGTGAGTSAINGWAKWYHAVSESAPSFQINETALPANNKKEWTVIGDESSFYLVSTPVSQSNDNKDIAAYTYGFGITEKKNFRVPFLLAHQQNVAVNSSDFFFNSNPLRYGWASSTILMTNNIGSYNQDLQAYPQYYLPDKRTDQTLMRSGIMSFNSLEPGIHFSKVMLHSSANAFMGAFPMLYSMQSSHSEHNDLHTFMEEGECFLLKKVAQGNTIGAFVFKVGEL